MTFSWSQQRFIVDLTTAVKWKIEQDVEAGVPFEQAKRDRIRQAETSWKNLTSDVRQAVAMVCWSIEPIDLSKRTRRSMKDQVRQAIEKSRGTNLGWFDRLLWRFTGMVWRV